MGWALIGRRSGDGGGGGGCLVPDSAACRRPPTARQAVSGTGMYFAILFEKAEADLWFWFFFFFDLLSLRFSLDLIRSAYLVTTARAIQKMEKCKKTSPPVQETQTPHPGFLPSEAERHTNPSLVYRQRLRRPIVP